MTNKIDRWVLCEVGRRNLVDWVYVTKPLQMFKTKIDAELAKKYFNKVLDYDK